MIIPPTYAFSYTPFPGPENALSSPPSTQKNLFSFLLTQVYK